TLFPYTTLFRSLQTCALVVAQVIAECATDSPVWIIACTIQSLQSRVYGRTSVGARLNATTGKPRFRGAAQPARARWSTPRLSSQHTDQQPKPGTDFRLAVLTKQLGLGRLGDRDHARVLEPTLDRDRIEALRDPLGPADHLHVVLALDLGLDHRGPGEHPDARLAEHLEQRAVVELPDDLR